MKDKLYRHYDEQYFEYVTRNRKTDYWSYIGLFIISGIAGAFVFYLVGEFVSKLLGLGKTTNDKYAWRGIGAVGIPFSACLFLLYICVTIVYIAVDCLFWSMLFLLLLFVSYKMVFDWNDV